MEHHKLYASVALGMVAIVVGLAGFTNQLGGQMASLDQRVASLTRQVQESLANGPSVAETQTASVTQVLSSSSLIRLYRPNGGQLLTANAPSVISWGVSSSTFRSSIGLRNTQTNGFSWIANNLPGLGSFYPSFYRWSPVQVGSNVFRIEAHVYRSDWSDAGTVVSLLPFTVTSTPVFTLYEIRPTSNPTFSTTSQAMIITIDSDSDLSGTPTNIAFITSSSSRINLATTTAPGMSYVDYLSKYRGTMYFTTPSSYLSQRGQFEVSLFKNGTKGIRNITFRFE